MIQTCCDDSNNSKLLAYIVDIAMLGDHNAGDHDDNEDEDDNDENGNDENGSDDDDNEDEYDEDNNEDKNEDNNDDKNEDKMMTMIVRPEHISQLPTLPLFVKSMQHHPHVQTLVFALTNICLQFWCVSKP